MQINHEDYVQVLQGDFELCHIHGQYLLMHLFDDDLK
jgi:hypothetical protein